MTREEIEAMPAGKFMDAAVAEVVLGYAWGHNNRCSFLRHEDDLAELLRYKEIKAGKHPDHDSGAWLGPDTSYSTNIEWAWLVLDKFPAPDWQIEMVRNGSTNNWTCMLRGYDKSGLATAPTLELAICRAALSTKLSYGQ